LAYSEPISSQSRSSPVASEVEPSSNHIATILVGPNTPLRECLARFLTRSNYRIVASEAAIANISPGALRLNRSMLLIIDADCEIETATKQATQFNGQRPSGHVVVLIDIDHTENVSALFGAGARAVCRNDANAQVFVKILERVMLDGPVDAQPPTPPKPGASFVEAAPKPLFRRAPRLLEQDLMILRCLAQGQSNNEIAMHTGICLATAKLRVKAILRKIGARNRTQAAVWAIRQDMFH
jgi:two-component system, NarL family, nitrate/nitrite response regulator NarL